MYPKIAAYLDEAGEEPLSACANLAKLGIKNIVLRFAWGGKNICAIPDHAHQKIKTAISEHNLNVVAIISNAGEQPAHHIFADEQLLRQAFLITEYYRADYVRIFCGTTSQHDVTEPITQWLRLITEMSIAANVVPIYEVTEECHYKSPTELATLLTSHKRLKLLYDPAQFLLKRKIDPFVKYWVLLRDHVAAVDIRDIKIGKGYTAVGFGDTRILDTVRDVVTDGDQWLFLEPSLGRRHRHTRTKAESFALAYNALQSAINEPKLKIGDQR